MENEAFERLYAEHAKPLLAFLVYRTDDRELAEDLVAETFERVLRKRRLFDRRKAGEKTWIYSIALNCVRDRARRRAAEDRALQRTEVPREVGSSVGIEQIDRRDAIGGAMEILSLEEREAIALRYGADLTVPEIAEVTKQPLQRVEGRVYRALRKLRDELEYFPERYG